MCLPVSETVYKTHPYQITDVNKTAYATSLFSYLKERERDKKSWFLEREREEVPLRIEIYINYVGGALFIVIY